VERTWDEGSVFAGAEDWDRACAEVLDEAERLGERRSMLQQGAAQVAAFLEEQERVLSLLDKVIIYTTLLSAVDAGDQAAAARRDRAGGVAARVRAALSFAQPELLGIGVGTLREWAGTEPRLRRFEHWIDRLARRAAHVRSAEVEELLGLAADPLRTARTVHGVLADAEIHFAAAWDSSGTEHPVVQSTYSDLLQSPDRDLRRSAFESYTDGYLALQRTIAACVAGGVKGDVFGARARGYGSSLEASLTENDIPTRVFHNVIHSFLQHLPTWHRYWRLRRRALGVDRLRQYDQRAVLAPPVKVPFEQAVEWICEGVRPLGEDYVEILRRGALEERWIDVYPNQGKRLGAFSTGAQGTHPFILISYADNVASLSTLAHELGHSMHTYLTSRAQPYVYSEYGIFIAEVASNMHQALVRADLLGRTDDENLQIALLEEAMGNFHRYLLVMPTLARLELEIHERVERGEPLTAAGLRDLTAGYLSDAYGEELEGDPERGAMLWAQFHTHLYSNFYVYQYTTGIAGAQVLARQVLEEGEPAAERYRSFLSAGSSRYPLDLLRDAGVDLEQREPVDTAFDALADVVGRLEALLD
jgi:oligoendopeptidase F